MNGVAERQCEPRLRSDWVLGFKSSNLGFVPGVKSPLRVRTYWPNALRWVIPAYPDGYGVLHECAQGFAQAIGAFRFCSAGCHETDYVFAMEQCRPLVAVSLTVGVRLPTELLDDVSAHPLRTSFHREIFKRTVVAYR